MAHPTTSQTTPESSGAARGMELSENIKRLRFMQAKKSTGGRSQQPVKQHPQKFFYQQQLHMLREHQRQHQELRVVSKGREDERSSSLVPQQNEAQQLRQLHELRRHWCAPGWECAEAMFAIQQEEDTKVQRQFAVFQSAGSRSKEASHVICRRAYGGMNAFVESNMRKIEKKVLQLESREEEEREAKRWQQIHSGRQGVSAL